MASEIVSSRPQTLPSWRIGVPYATITLVLLLIVWQVAAITLDIPGYLLPSPLAILRSMAVDWRMLLSHSWVTVVEICAGFVISVMIGVPIAVFVSYSRLFDRAVYPLIVGSQTIPKVAIAPILLAWFGFGVTPKMIIVVLVSFFPIVINTVVGLRAAPPQMIHLARSMGASAWQIFWRFRLPQALPSVFAGMKMATILAVIGATVAEFVGAESGTGYLIMIAGSNFDIARQFSAVTVLSLVGMAFFWLVERIERMCLPWHVSIRTQTE